MAVTTAGILFHVHPLARRPCVLGRVIKTVLADVDICDMDKDVGTEHVKSGDGSRVLTRRRWGIRVLGSAQKRSRE